MPLDGSEQILKELDEARRRLVDTGRRNKLIHTPSDAKRSNAIAIVNADADDVYVLLKQQSEKLGFRAVPTSTALEVGNKASIQTRVTNGDTDPSDLQTALSSEVLQRRLLKLYRDAKSAEDEQGANILFLAIGFLKWFESPDSSELCEAPLFLIPVSLIRDRAGSRFRLASRDDDLNTNIALQERLREFAIDLPEISDDDEVLPSEYLSRVERVISQQQRWSIDSKRIQLGFFSFSKFLMVRDLLPENWTEDSLAEHPLIRALLLDTFGSSEPLFPSDVKLDEVLDPSKLFHVVDADASQAVVIETVRSGRNLVVQGPPGTGKSQTITNIIAAAVSDGKRVLFLSEKRAALEVVFKKLCGVGLENICFELHSRKANKRSVIQEVERTLSDIPSTASSTNDVDRLRKVRDQLNADSESLNRFVGTTGVTPFYAIGKQVQFATQNHPPPNLSITELAVWPESHFKEALQKVALLAEIIQQYGTLSDHPWRGVRNLTLQPLQRQRLLQDITKLSASISSVRRGMEGLAEVLNCPSDVAIGDLYEFIDLFRRIAKKPNLSNGLLAATLNCADQERLSQVGSTGQKFLDAYRQIERHFKDEMWTTDLQPIRSAIAKGVESWLFRLSNEYRGQSKLLSKLLKIRMPKKAPDRLTLVDTAQYAQGLRAKISSNANFAGEVLGALWQGFRTDFNALFSASAWAKLMNTRPRGASNDGCLRLGEKPAALLQFTDHFEAMVKDSISNFANLVVSYDIDLMSAFNVKEIGEIKLSAICAKSEEWGVSEERFEEWVRLKLADAAVRDSSLAALADRLASGSLSSELATSELEYARADAVWTQAVKNDPKLASMDGKKRTQLVADFKTLELKRQKFAADAVINRHLATLPRSGDIGMPIIRGQIARKRSHMPIRKLVQNAGIAIQKIKPVFLMSPLSVAQFLPPGAITFDLLVIDEASQVRPEDALGAVARAKQIVVVGDNKQLPPTSFFDRMVADEELNEDADDDSSLGVPRPIELESILSLSEAQGMSNSMLTWHYRSRHPSLIQVSNKLFYENRLFFPPSVKFGQRAEGLTARYVPGRYDRGGTRTNEIEAKEILNAIKVHATESPDISLGVVTFSTAQKELIENLLEVERRHLPTLDAFMQKAGPDDFFVKNLETVQGDERDVILVSIGYGPRIAGAGLDSMGFGPVSSEGGERRLNVLFTRAKLRCEIFVSFHSGDIDLQRTTKEGPKALKEFLYFAETGIPEVPLPTGADADSPFEENVQQAIAELGYVADGQVGSAGFKIDLAVRDKKSSRYLLAVECDGATYHRARWARERDRLRQDVLEQFGWRFHRIWSTDWFNNRKREIRRLAEAIQRAEFESPPPSNGGKAIESSIAIAREKSVSEMRLN